MIEALRRLAHLWRWRPRELTRLEKMWLALRTDSYVAADARLYRGGFIILGRGCQLHSGVILNLKSPGGRIVLGDRVKVLPGVKIIAEIGSILIGSDVSINYDCVLYGRGGLTIGDNCRLAAGCKIVPSNHRYADPAMPIRDQGLSETGVQIETDVWLGFNVSVLEGACIGRGSVIGAGSVVTRSVPPYSIAVGIPARILKSRLETVAPPNADSDADRV